MIGGALGALQGMVFPHVAPGFWALVGLAAVVGGVMRSPFTGVVFSLELTHDWSALLPLLVSASAAYGLSVLILKRSVLTEKVARHGHHLTREYSIDPLEVLFVEEVMWSDVVTFCADEPLREVVARFLAPEHVQRHDRQHRQRLYPVVDRAGRLVGVLSRRDLLDAALTEVDGRLVSDVMVADPVTVHGDQTLREVAYLFAESGVTRAPVVDEDDPTRLVGLVTLTQLLAGRLRDLQEERDTERVLSMRLSPSLRRLAGRAREEERVSAL
jgi:CBS domain-containing protein